MEKNIDMPLTQTKKLWAYVIDKDNLPQAVFDTKELAEYHFDDNFGNVDKNTSIKYKPYYFQVEYKEKIDYGII